MKVIVIFICSLIFFLPSQSRSQNSDAVDLEVGGPSLIYSVNFDKRIETNYNLGFRIGFGILPYDFPHGSPLVIVPILINMVLPKKHSFESAIGITNVITKDDQTYIGDMLFAYRLHKNNGLLFRCGVNFLVKFYDRIGVFEDENAIKLFPMLSLGKSF